MTRLTQKRALVTGGSRGIGSAIVKRLVAEGADVAFTYVSSAEKAQALVAELEKTGRKIVAIKADSSNVQEIKSAVDQTATELGGLDILVNNAGVFRMSAVDNPEHNAADMDHQMAVNVVGVAAAVRAAVAHLGDGGRIVSIGSVAGDGAPWPGIGDYAASKAAVAAYTRGWAKDLGPKNITVNTVQPGPIDTDMNPADSELSAMVLPSVPLGRYGKAEEVAAAVAFLASPEASYITGTTLNVDGGVRA